MSGFFYFNVMFLSVIHVTVLLIIHIFVLLGNLVYYEYIAVSIYSYILQTSGKHVLAIMSRVSVKQF